MAGSVSKVKITLTDHTFNSITNYYENLALSGFASRVYVVLPNA